MAIRKCILGSQNVDSINKFIKQKDYAINYDQNKDIYKFRKKGRIGRICKRKIYINCNFHTLNPKIDNLKKFAKKDIERIYLLENLNPRPETLDNDMTILSGLFAKQKLEHILKIYFTGNSHQSLETIRSEFLKFDSFFDYLGIRNDDAKKREFVKNRIGLIRN